MKIRFDPCLAEAIVFQEIIRRQDMGDPTPFRDYHLAADPLYHCSHDTREASLRRLHALFFERLGYAQGVQQAGMSSRRLRPAHPKSLWLSPLLHWRRGPIWGASR